MRRGTHANLGRLWEQEIETAHAHYVAQGLYVQVNPRRVRALAPTQLLQWVLGKPPDQRRLSGYGFPAIWEATSPPDCLALISGLPALLLDAKSVKGDRWALTELKEHQAQAFDRWERNTGKAFLLLRMDRTDGFPHGRWLLPWTGTLATLWHAKADGRAKHGDGSLTITDCDLMGARLDSADWLRAARSLWGVTVPSSVSVSVSAATAPAPAAPRLFGYERAAEVIAKPATSELRSSEPRGTTPPYRRRG